MIILRKKLTTVKNSKGEWKFRTIPKGTNPTYKDSLISYLNALSPLFDKARSKSEFEFILTLLRVKSLKDIEWNPWENTIKVFDSVTKLIKKIKDFNTKRHLSLWLYCHIVEASEPYEVIANLINIVDEKRFNIKIFPDKQKGKYKIPLKISEKKDKLKKMFNKINMNNSILPFQDVFVRELRNAISHSDYTLYGGEVRINNKNVKIYNHKEIQSLINKAVAYLDAFKCLISVHISSYQTLKVISVHPEFSEDPQEQAVTIIRKGHGLVGVKDNWTKEELNKGHIPFRIGHFYRYELNLLKKDPFLAILPFDRIKKVNNILKFLPKFLSKYIYKKIKDKF